MTTPRSVPTRGAITIYRAGPEHRVDLGTFGALVGSAFADLSAVRWLIPDDAPTRALIFGRWAAIHIADALNRGHVDVIDLNEVPVAVAVWFTNPHTDPPADYDEQLLHAVGGEHIDRFRTLDTVMDAAHPHGQHHHHLLLLATRPGRQNTGYGSALLAHHHRQLDAAGIPGYLEAASLDSARLYERHGYQPLGDPLTLPGNTVPDLWPMWREPQPNPSHTDPSQR